MITIAEQVSNISIHAAHIGSNTRMRLCNRWFRGKHPFACIRAVAIDKQSPLFCGCSKSTHVLVIVHFWPARIAAPLAGQWRSSCPHTAGRVQHSCIHSSQDIFVVGSCLMPCQSARTATESICTTVLSSIQIMQHNSGF